MTAPLWPGVADHLDAQERIDELRARYSRVAGRNLSDLAYANPYEGAPPEVVQALRDVLADTSHLNLQYTPYGGATVARRQVAHAIAASHDLPMEWRDVVLTPGAMAALTVAFCGLVDGPLGADGPGELLIPTPCWLDYPLYAAQHGLRPVLVPARPDTLRLDLDAIAAAITPRTRAVVLSQPGNPTGLLHAEDELRALAELLGAQPDPPWIISDECHRDVLMVGERFVSPAAFHDRTVIVYSFGKVLFAQGQRLGYVAVSPRAPAHLDVARAFERLCRSLGVCTPTALMQAAVGRLLGLRADQSHVVRRRTRALAGLTEAGYDVVPSQATFFLYPACPPGLDDMSFAATLAEQGVLVLPARVFHHAGHFRLSLTCSDSALERALDVLASVGPLTGSRR